MSYDEVITKINKLKSIFIVELAFKITGLPATGKTRLAKIISDSLQIPLISKDSIKVPILKQLGVRDRSWDINVGITAVNLQMILAIELLNKKISLILESNYKEEYDTSLIMNVIEYTNCECLQIVCGTHGPTLVDRYIKRENSSERPKELILQGNVEEFQKKLLKGYDEPLKISGKLIKVDTTDFELIPLTEIISSVESFLLH